MLEKYLNEQAAEADKPPDTSNSEAEAQKQRDQQYKPVGLKVDATRFEKIVAKLL